jgi:hypothetical protein
MAHHEHAVGNYCVEESMETLEVLAPQDLLTTFDGINVAGK